MGTQHGNLHPAKRLHTQNAPQSHFHRFLQDIFILKSGCSLKSSTHLNASAVPHRLAKIYNWIPSASLMDTTGWTHRWTQYVASHAGCTNSCSKQTRYTVQILCCSSTLLQKHVTQRVTCSCSNVLVHVTVQILYKHVIAQARY